MWLFCPTIMGSGTHVLYIPVAVLVRVLHFALIDCSGSTTSKCSCCLSVLGLVANLCFKFFGTTEQAEMFRLR